MKLWSIFPEIPRGMGKIFPGFRGAQKPEFPGFSPIGEFRGANPKAKFFIDRMSSILLTNRHFWRFDRNYRTKIFWVAREPPEVPFDTIRIGFYRFLGTDLAIYMFLISSIFVTNRE